VKRCAGSVRKIGGRPERGCNVRLTSISMLAIFGAISVAHAQDGSSLREWIATADKVLPPQDQALLNAMVVHMLGTDDTCPRFRVIKSEVKKEMDDAGVKLDAEHSEHIKMAGALVFDMLKHSDDRSQLCREAWEIFGPNGTYRRQMLESQN